MRTIRVAEGCTRCPELVANRSCIVHGYGAADAQVVFIGEAPGYRGGDVTGVPFTLDRSGVRLQRVLIELGLSEETEPRIEQPRLRCFITNVVRCNPPSNRTPSRAEAANCQPYLWLELELIQPRIIVPVGSVAARAVFPHILDQPAPPITKAHAQVFAHDGRWVVPMRHPARVPAQDGRWVVPMRHPARISNADLARFGEVLGRLLRQVS
jgi:uracil-DNA glycosylase family 4